MAGVGVPDAGFDFATTDRRIIVQLKTTFTGPPRELAACATQLALACRSTGAQWASHCMVERFLAVHVVTRAVSLFEDHGKSTPWADPVEIANFCTIIGIPFGIQHLKLAACALAPVGKTIVPKEVAAEARRRNARAHVDSRRW